jgi:hypothetical protein
MREKRRLAAARTMFLERATAKAGRRARAAKRKKRMRGSGP